MSSFPGSIHFSSSYHHLILAPAGKTATPVCCDGQLFLLRMLGRQIPGPGAATTASTIIAAWPSPARKKAPGGSWAWPSCRLPGAWGVMSGYPRPAFPTTSCWSAPHGVGVFSAAMKPSAPGPGPAPQILSDPERGLLPGHFGGFSNTSTFSSVHSSRSWESQASMPTGAC